MSPQLLIDVLFNTFNCCIGNECRERERGDCTQWLNWKSICLEWFDMQSASKVYLNCMSPRHALIVWISYSSYLTDFEEVRLGDSDEEFQREFDGFEEVELPDDDVNGTKKCRCPCHRNTTDEQSIKRIRHCQNCSLKVSGFLFF